VTPNATRGVALATVTALLWGTVPIAGKIALGGISPSLLSTGRLLLAAGALAAFLKIRGRLRLRRPPRLVYLAGLGLGANYVLYMLGLSHSTAGTAQVLIQTAPLFLIVLSMALLGERPSPRQLLGMGLALAGVAVVSWSDQERPEAGLGMLLILASAASWAVYGVCHKRLGKDHTSGGTMTWIFLVAGLASLPTTIADASLSPGPVEWAAIAYLAANAIAAYVCFGECLRHIDASLASVICTLGPVVTLALVGLSNSLDGALIPYEAVPASKLAGAGLVMLGVVLAVARATRSP